MTTTSKEGRFPRAPGMAQEPSEAVREVRLAGGGLLFFGLRREGGPGLPLVLLHGFTGTAASWDAVATRLRQHTLALDMPGHGRTSPTVPTGPWNPAAVADALAEALPPRFDLAGYSAGGRLALQLAARHPARVRRLALVGAHPGLADPSDRAVRVADDEVWARRLEHASLEAFYRAWDDRPLFATRRDLPAAEAAHAARLAQDPGGLAWALRNMGLGRQPLLGTSVPTLWIAGQWDERFGAIARAAAAPPTARALLIPRAGHDVPLERPAALARVLSTWFGRPAAPREEQP